MIFIQLLISCFLILMSIFEASKGLYVFEHRVMSGIYLTQGLLWLIIVKINGLQVEDKYE